MPHAMMMLTCVNWRNHLKPCRAIGKQIVFGLNITADGNVHLIFELFEGNRTDNTTHVPNWKALREFLEKVDTVSFGFKAAQKSNRTKIGGKEDVPHQIHFK